MSECAAQGYQAFRVTLEGEFAYWTVLDDSFHRVEEFDAFLLYLRTGRGQAEGTTEAYARDLAVVETWRVASGRALVEAARDLHLFVAHLRTSPIERQGRGHGGRRSSNRIGHMLCSRLAWGGGHLGVGQFPLHRTRRRRPRPRLPGLPAPPRPAAKRTRDHPGGKPARPLPIRPRPVSGESPDSYLRRLARANHLRPSYLRRYLREPGGEGAIRLDWLAILAARPLPILERVLDGAASGPGVLSPARPAAA